MRLYVILHSVLLLELPVPLLLTVTLTNQMSNHFRPPRAVTTRTSLRLASPTFAVRTKLLTLDTTSLVFIPDSLISDLNTKLPLDR